MLRLASTATLCPFLRAPVVVSSQLFMVSQSRALASVKRPPSASVQAFSRERAARHWVSVSMGASKGWRPYPPIVGVANGPYPRRHSFSDWLATATDGADLTCDPRKIRNLML
jgi:hypothetical protein